MCWSTCIDFARDCLGGISLDSLSVLEAGSRDVNGSLRPWVEHTCAEYIGIDIETGPGVDQICDIKDLEREFGRERFDVIICTEVVEHVADWKTAIHNLKAVLRPGGHLLLTTRSKGFGYHGFPHDFWRYEKKDMTEIFSEFDLLSLQDDPGSFGVFVFARKPQEGWQETDLNQIRLYSILHHRRLVSMPERWDKSPSFRMKVWAIRNREFLKRMVPRSLRQRIYDKVFR